MSTRKLRQKWFGIDVFISCYCLSLKYFMHFFKYKVWFVLMNIHCPCGKLLHQGRYLQGTIEHYTSKHVNKYLRHNMKPTNETSNIFEFVCLSTYTVMWLWMKKHFWGLYEPILILNYNKLYNNVRKITVLTHLLSEKVEILFVNLAWCQQQTNDKY